jgi:hypothetical protein
VKADEETCAAWEVERAATHDAAVEPA